jgi:sialate O-acetylesterase
LHQGNLIFQHCLVMHKTPFFFLLFLLTSISLDAKVRVPKFFGDNMVLQRDRLIPVWGWASPKEKITVLLDRQAKMTTAGKDGKWRIDLDPQMAGGPYELQIRGKDTLLFHNVLIGDVWICSGQSNMEWQLRSAKDGEKEAMNADFPQIRHFEVPHTVASIPKDDVPGGAWKVCSPATAGSFTAVGYFFAKELYHELHVPIGLLHTSWGGTHVETWTSRSTLEEDEEFGPIITAMPQLDLDSLAAHKAADMRKKIELIQGPSAITEAEIHTWKELSCDDSKWPMLKVPGIWEDQILGDFDGVVWYRKTITVTATDAGKEATLELAKIDDNDDTYVNGQKIGSTQAWDAKRKYVIPAGLLKEGKNVIAVRVLDTGGGGGIWGDPEDVEITLSSGPVSLAGKWPFHVETLSKTLGGIGPNSYPTLLSNAMINPLVPFGIKGAIWYQGESNSARAYQYRKAFPLMIKDWRKRWNQGDFPFYFVQLASFLADHKDNGSTWAELREAQAMTLTLPNTGMAVTTDIGDPTDIHPKNKLDVGKRLAAVALVKTYGRSGVFSGPTFTSMQVEGDHVMLHFDNLGTGLMAKDKYGYLKGFEIAGPDQKFYFAKAFVKGNQVVVYQDGVPNPVAVRFGWANDAGEDNLFNKEGFPAPPFRTDNWKGITEGVKYQIGD